MKTSIAKLRTGACLAIAAFGAASVNAQQPPQPQPFKNLTAYPKDIPRPELLLNMRLFTQALGVQCDHCHVGREFEKDDKPAKNVARAMIRMVQDLKTHSADFLPDGRAAKVACWTCHRGAATFELPPPPEMRAPGGKKGGAPKAD